MIIILVEIKVVYNLFKKACQRSPVGAKMWNSHMPYKLGAIYFKRYIVQ